MLKRCALLLPLLLVSCQTEQGRVRQLVSSGAVRVEEASSPGHGYDYAVTISSAPGLGYDPSSRVEREALAGQAAGPTCAAPLIVREDMIAAGPVASGKTASSYVLRVRCRPA